MPLLAPIGRNRIAESKWDAPPPWRWAWEGLFALYIPQVGDGWTIPNRAPGVAGLHLTHESSPVYDSRGCVMTSAYQRASAAFPLAWYNRQINSKRLAVMWAGYDTRNAGSGSTYSAYFGINPGTPGSPNYIIGIEREYNYRRLTVISATSGNNRVDVGSVAIPSSVTTPLCVIGSRQTNLWSVVGDPTAGDIGYGRLVEYTANGSNKWGYSSRTPQQIFLGNAYASESKTPGIVTTASALWFRSHKYADMRLLHADPLAPFTRWQRRWSGVAEPAPTAHPLAATIEGSLSASADLTVAKPLTSALACSLSVSAGLTVAKPLAVALSASIANTTASLTVAKPLATACTGTMAVSASLSVAKPLAASLSAGMTQSGAALTVSKPLASALSAGIATSATLDVSKPLAITLSVAMTASAGLTVAKPLAVDVAASLTASATLEALGFAAALTGSLSTSADLTAPINIAVALISTLSVSAALTVSKPLAVSLQGAVTAAASLAVPKPLAASVMTSLSSSAVLTVSKPLAANIALALSCTGSLAVPKPLAVDLTAMLFTTADLSGPMALPAYFNGTVESQTRYRGSVQMTARTRSALVQGVQMRIADGSRALYLQVQSNSTVESRPQTNADITLRAGEP